MTDPLLEPKETIGATLLYYGTVLMGVPPAGDIVRQTEIHTAAALENPTVTATLSCRESSGGDVFAVYKIEVNPLPIEHTQIMIDATYLGDGDPPDFDVMCNYVIMGSASVHSRTPS